jgi:hypothetical protein
MFERMNSLNPPSLRSLKQPVVWNEDVYALGRDSKGDGNLYKYSLSSNEWSNFAVPSSIYASNSVLTTYSSKLLLISGQNMTLWEFSNNDFDFKESCIEPVPSTYPLPWRNILATSYDKYLIIAYEEYLHLSSQEDFVIYNGRDWKLRHLDLRIMLRSNTSCDVAAMDSHALYMIVFSTWDNDVDIQRALIPSLDESEDKATHWEELEMIPLKELDALLYGRRYSIIIQNQQFYCVDSQGILFTAFIQPPILPIVWGNSGVNFDQAPRLVGLPEGDLLMIGTIGNQNRSQLDVIKVSQKGNYYIQGLIDS